MHMATPNLLSRITLSPEICHGKPCIRGMRWPVEVVLDLFSSGMTQAEILEDHPELEPTAFLKDRQNLPLGLLAGLGAALGGAVLWAVITVATEYQIGYMAKSPD